MAIEYLTESGSATIEAGQLEIELTLHSGGPARIQVMDGAGTEVPILRLSDTKVVVTEVTTAMRLVADSPTGEFPEDTVVEAAFSTSVEGRTSQVFGQKTDLSALDEVELAEVSRRGDQVLVIRALKVDDAALDPNLTPLAKAALRSARRLRKAGEIARSAHGVALCFDTSASMTPYRRSGLLQMLTEIALGVDRGMGDGGDVPAFAVDRRTTQLQPVTSQNGATYALDVLTRIPATTGFRPSSAAGTRGLDDHERTILVVTDSVPADADRCVEQWSAPGPVRWRLLLIGQPGTSVESDGLTIGLIDPGLPGQDLTGDTGRLAMDRLVSTVVGPADHGRA